MSITVAASQGAGVLLRPLPALTHRQRSWGSYLRRCNTESEWSQIHENIIKKLNARYNLTGSNAGECAAAPVGPRSALFPPHLAQLRRRTVSTVSIWARLPCCDRRLRSLPKQALPFRLRPGGVSDCSVGPGLETSRW